MDTRETASPGRAIRQHREAEAARALAEPDTQAHHPSSSRHGAASAALAITPRLTAQRARVNALFGLTAQREPEAAALAEEDEADEWQAHDEMIEDAHAAEQTEDPAESELSSEAQQPEARSLADEAIDQLLSYATEAELDAMISGEQVADEGEEELAADTQQEDEPVQARLLATPLVQRVKQQPKHPGRYQATTAHGGRTYYHRIDPVTKRTTKFSGPLVYVKGGRVGTPKVAYKRKNDAAGHLIAHSFGGPPKYTGNFVAMDSYINGAGGDWGKMEHYIRQRLKAKSTAAYMSVTPLYANGTSKRPTSIVVTAHFNRKPFKKQWTVNTP
jgi:hypothetical protein